jgi:transcriptional regulator with XRE-family HTH domain
MAAKLGVSKRTLSTWENGYALPGVRQRAHVVLSLLDAPPESLVEMAEALGVSGNPAVAAVLKPHREALSPKPSATRPPPSPEVLRAAVDTIVRDAADAMNVPANDLREAIGRAVAACDDLGATMEGTRGAVTVRARAKRAAPTDG